MDIQLKKKPWYIRHLTHIITGGAFVGLLVFVCVTAFRPRRVNIDIEDYRTA